MAHRPGIFGFLLQAERVWHPGEGAFMTALMLADLPRMQIDDAIAGPDYQDAALYA